MASSGMFRRVALVRTDVSEELRPSFIRVTRFCELGTTLAVTSNRRTLRRNTKYLVFLRSVRRLLVTASVVSSSLILVTLMKEVFSSSETSVLTRAILHSHRHENLTSYRSLNVSALSNPYSRSMVESASNRNECQKIFLWLKRGGCIRLTTQPPSKCQLSRKCGIFNISRLYGPPRPLIGIGFFNLPNSYQYSFPTSFLPLLQSHSSVPYPSSIPNSFPTLLFLFPLSSNRRRRESSPQPSNGSCKFLGA
jgi:hypothetical protein